MFVPPSLSAALLNVLDNNPTMNVSLVFATITGFTAVLLHAYTSLKLHLDESVRTVPSLLNPTTSDIRPGPSYQTTSCVHSRIFGRVHGRDPIRLACALLVPGGMQLILLR